MAGHQYSTGWERFARVVMRFSVLVILGWVAVGAVVNLAFPQLERVANEKAVPPLPDESISPALRVTKDIATITGQAGLENAVVVVIDNRKGATPLAQARYESLVKNLQAEKESIRFVNDALGDPQIRTNPLARSSVISENGNVWVLPVGLSGELGSPEGAVAVRKVQAVVAGTYRDDPDSRGYVTGAPAITSDLAEHGVRELPIVGAVTVVVVAIILLIVFRSFTTALLPLLVMGVSLLVARGVVAGLANVGVLPVSGMSSGLMMAVLMGASVNYTVFMLSRYHENLRAGLPPPEAIARASGSMSRVILATAATIAIANIAQILGKLRFLSAAGPSVAVAIVIAFLVVTTMLPAVLHLSAQRGWLMPGRELTKRYWRRVGVTVVRHPGRVFALSMTILLGLAAFVPFLRENYDNTADLPKDMPSVAGTAVLNSNFPANVTQPQLLLVRTKSDLRTPAGLADLDELARNIGKVPGVSRVQSITRPSGEKLTEATLAWQLGQIGAGAQDAARQVQRELEPQLDRMAKIGDAVSAMLAGVDPDSVAALRRELPGVVAQAREAQSQVDAYQAILGTVEPMAAMVDQLRTAGPAIARLSSALSRALSVIEPAQRLIAVIPNCDGIPECRTLRQHVRDLEQLRRSGALDDAGRLPTMFDDLTGGKSAVEFVRDSRNQLAFAKRMLDRLPELERQYQSFAQGMDRLAELGVDLDAGRSMPARIRELRAEMDRNMDVMTSMAAYLQTQAREADTASGSGFYLPVGMLRTPDIEAASKALLGDDGRAAILMFQSDYSPFGNEAMMLSRSVHQAALDSLPNTELAGAEVGVGGFPAVLSDLKAAYDADFREMIVVTVLIILVVMAFLLRAAVAPLYLMGTVLLTYVASLGAGVLLFQVILGQEIYWVVPAMCFVMIVAVGADYNMLFMSRLREEAGAGVRTGLLRTVNSTGAVISSAGLVFAACLMGMMSSSVVQMAQMGFIIGFGILLDTFVVRTLMVPVLAQVFGTKSWWPAKA